MKTRTVKLSTLSFSLFDMANYSEYNIRANEKKAQDTPEINWKKVYLVQHNVKFNSTKILTNTDPFISE
ncbi:MAG TPA: hypothetical protein VE818_02905 [Nitrososphaeraceae archaeon]|nr:hypothetical protein [Nitrososphaeraceae archaeon]